MAKLVARSLLSSDGKKALVYYSTDNAHYVGNDRYSHGDYAIINLEKNYDQKAKELIEHRRGEN